MAYTIYEYTDVRGGQPVEPAAVRTATKALGAAHVCAKATVYVAVVPDADMYLRVSAAGTAATSADHKLVAGATYGFPIAHGSQSQLYGIATA